MKNKIFALIVSFAVLGFWGCGESFLDVEPSQFLSAEQVAEAAALNPDVIAGSMSGIYTLTFNTGTGGTGGHDDFGQKGYDIFSDMLSGDLALSASAYGWYRTITEFQTTQDFTFQDNYQVWRYYYRLIRSANLVIDALGGNDATPALDENKYIMGQAKAMRANSYFYLAQFFQPAYNPSEEILPLYTTPNDPNGPKVTAQEVYDLMVDDLTDAISLLNGFTRTAKSQVDMSVAQGMLAYVYGAMGNYAEVKTLTAAVINSGAYPIVDATEATGGFNDVNTPGWMWGVDLTSDIGLNLVSWWGQMDAFTYSYQWAGDRKAIDQGLFDQIPANDVRKGQFLDNPASGYHLVAINKFYDPARVTGGQRYITTDYLYMRVAEMYLLNAEASAKTGDEATARTSLKALLAERFSTPAEYAYVDLLTGQALEDEIYLQTRIELYAEGKSYLAMKRNQATIVRGSNHLSNVGVPISYDDDRLTFEVPQSEIQNNPFIN
ncbi:MAG: RagB/SusD family nutrient uptake outer membrane protein [Cytophagia bacterium]|nr:RagB/SusD family nutrient uptake outer membrane protein [Cytophagia bacterium]NVK83876.1 RagB/SusD family nutrient uptake outer membrane protein [Cytophagia bacterium]